MISATAWNNGQHHRSGYGLSVSASDRDRYLRREWGLISLQIGNAEPFSVNIDKQSFWDGSCIHLIHAEIGSWLLASRVAPWPERQPPKFSLAPLSERAFQIRALCRI